ncbi:MAG: homoserine kinase [Candidatus Aminicenantales bacterium]
MNEIVIRSPATVANFGPGFDIFALALETPFDVLKIRLKDTPSIHLRITGAADDIPTSAEKNTAGLAAIHFFKRVNSSAGAEIEIVKRMPTGAGLGSSAASAAACVFGLNRLLQANLEPRELIEIASRAETASGGAAHADNVSGCLLGGFIYVRSYYPLDVVRIDAPEIPVVIAVIKKSQTTTRSLIPNLISLTRVKEQMSSCASVIHAVLNGDLKAIGAAVNTDHISEPVRSKFIPGYGEIKKKALEAGAYGCNVSGGGSSVFVICEKGQTAEMARLIQTHFNEKEIRVEVVLTRASNTGLREINEL